jgi:hypothetical protein
MKPNRFERNYRDTFPLKSGVAKEFSNATPMSRTAGKINMDCDHCGLAYETYACWAKRVAHHYCSRACASAAKETPVEKTCIVCGSVFTTVPSSLKRHSTCSINCLKKNRARLLKIHANDMSKSPIYNYGNHERGSQVSKKLTEEDVKKIKADQRPQTAIAKDYGIGQTTVSHIKTGKSWMHVVCENL